MIGIQFSDGFPEVLSICVVESVKEVFFRFSEQDHYPIPLGIIFCMISFCFRTFVDIVENFTFAYSLFDCAIDPRKPSMWDCCSVQDAQIHNSQEAISPICPAAVDISHHDKVSVYTIQVVSHGVEVSK